LGIPSVSHNKKAVLDYLDDELEKSTRLDKETEKEILHRLSANGELPTDLYTIKMDDAIAIKKIRDNFKINENLITETIKNPDMVYNFGANYCASIFTKFYKKKHEYNSFFLLIVGTREGLVFMVNQVWQIYTDLISEKSFADALELLKYFVEKFGVEVNFRGETSKFFINVLAKSEKEFQIRMDASKLKMSEKRSAEFITCHFIGQVPDSDDKFLIFYAIDIEKYKEYIKRHSKIVHSSKKT
jgi:hypothetical protein